MSAEDLLDHFRLEAEVYPNYTLHHRVDRRRGRREKHTTKWDRVERIGEGAFGQVWKEVGIAENSPKDIRAVKIVNKERTSRYNIDFKKELLALAKLAKDEYKLAEVFVLFQGWFETEHDIFLAMEYIGKGDLSQHIPISTEDEVRQITTDILEGLKIMHAEGFAHRDLKPQNIFVIDDSPLSWHVKIGDFGISKRVQNEDTAYRTETGTPLFQAPEMLGFLHDYSESSTYSNAVDMWSLGCVVYNVVAGKLPFSKRSEINGFCSNRLTFPTEPLHSTMQNVGIDFVQHLLAPHPTKRLSAEAALGHPWIADEPVFDSRLRSCMEDVKKSVNNEETMTPRPHQKSCLYWQDQTIIREHTDYYAIRSVAFSPDTQFIATGSLDGIIHVWNTTSGNSQNLSLLFRLHFISTVQEIVFSPDGKHLAFALQQSKVGILKNQGPREKPWPLTTINDTVREVSVIRFSTYSNVLAYAESNGTVCFCNVVNGKPIRAFKYPNVNRIYDMAFSPDSQSLTITSQDGSSLSHDLEQNTYPSQLLAQSSDRPSLAVAFDEDGQRIYASTNGMIMIGHTIVQKPFSRSDIVQATISPGGHRVVFQYLSEGDKPEHGLLIWDRRLGTTSLVSGHGIGFITAIAFSPISGQFAFAAIRGKIGVGRVIDPQHSQSDNSGGPELSGALSQAVPSEEDMNHEDPDMKPREQKLRFDGDLYTPRFVRGRGTEGEGFCGLCKPGRWLQLKNSAFWYDKSFKHGINAATGLRFNPPIEARLLGKNSGSGEWEGLCGSCNEWITRDSEKGKGTAWFRHAYKCHAQQKAKGARHRSSHPSSSNHNAVLDPNGPGSSRLPRGNSLQATQVHNFDQDSSHDFHFPPMPAYEPKNAWS